MNENADCIKKFTSKETIEFILDIFHRTTIHHAMWFAEVMEQYGREKAYEILNDVYKQSYELQFKRISKVFDINLTGNLPAYLLNLSEKKQDELTESLSLNWLANDGIWFQAVEKSKGMLDAKRCNDSCWANFSPFEASSIKSFINLPDNSGLEGLKKALQFRLYAFINKQLVKEETPNSFVFCMNECRVQVARKRKGLDDYPCKSAGIVEYSTFAKAIDSRIKTECISCPPDPHTEEYFCAWKFYVEK